MASQISRLPRSDAGASAIVFLCGARRPWVEAILNSQMLLKRLKRWLGWDSEAGLLDFSDFSARPRSTQPPPKPPAATQTRATEPTAAPQRRAKTERAPADVLDNPRLTLDKPADDGFDPYNTGAFNRSTSWERIGRQRKR